MTLERWQRLLAALHIPTESSTYEALVAAYGESHRHYHTGRHIAHCLEELDLARSLAQEPAEVEMALWFHDAIYQPQRSDNEERSAQWAERFLGDCGVAAERVERIRAHILATRHTAGPSSADGQWVVDVDLAILGSEAKRYEEFEREVRQEYHWVPGPLFRTKRAQILQSFLDRPYLYHTPLFQERYEAAARRNLSTAIKTLRG